MHPTSSSRRRPSASRPKLVQKKLVQQTPASKIPDPKAPPREKPVQKNPVRRKPASRKPLPAQPCSPSARLHEINTKRRGELAELEFVLKAANLGFGVARPYGDSERYDVILDAREILPRRRRAGQACAGRALLPASVPATKNGVSKNANPKGKKPRRQSSEIPPLPPDPSPPDPSPPLPSPPLWRIQVKCSTQLFEGLYRVNAHRRLNGRAVPYLPGEIHFFAIYIIPEDTWYIIPLHATFGVTSLLFRRRPDRRPGLYDAYREAWQLLRPQS